jgi:hypothetical protein
MKNRIARLRADAEANFRNFEGITYGARYRNAVAPQGVAGMARAEVLDPNDRTWTVQVVNAATTAVSDVRIFGAAKDLTDANKDSDITITVAESSHLQVKTELLTTPVRILGLKYSVTTAAQFSNALTLVDETSNGAKTQRVWQPLNFRSAQNNLTTQIDAPTFEMLLSATSYIEFDIAASETVTFTFTIVEKGLQKNILRGAPAIAASTTMAPTGLPQIDLRRGL